MKITEVRITPAPAHDEKGKSVLAYATITINECLVIHDIKIISVRKGIFIAMPSRKVMAHCPSCDRKNALRARYCNECGRTLSAVDDPGTKGYVDVAHPINNETREMIADAVMRAYGAAVVASHNEATPA